MASVRFSQVVAAAGEPAPHVFWLPPEQDAEFQRALKAHRVMTVAPRARGKADMGRVGFDAKEANSGQVLVFPKSLKRFEDAEIVGVKFDLVEQPGVVAAKTELRRRTAKTKRGGHGKPPQREAAIPGPRAGPTQRNAAAPPRQAKASAEPRRDVAAPVAETRRSRTAPPARLRAQEKPRAARHSAEYDRLAKEVRVALDELRDGKAVAAYQRLERALG